MAKIGGSEAKMGGGGGGRHGSGHSSKNVKPSYMSHIPDNHLNTKPPHSSTADSMTQQNLMGCGGGDHDRGR